MAYNKIIQRDICIISKHSYYSSMNIITKLTPIFLLRGLIQWVIALFSKTNKAEKNTYNKQLITRILCWDNDAYNDLVEQRSQQLFCYIYHYCNYDKQTAKDALQEVFFHLRKNLHKYDQSKPFQPRLYRLTRNKTIDWLKSQKKEYPIVTDPIDFHSSQTYTNNKRKQFLIKSLLERLDPQTKEIVLYYYFEEYSYQEIADILWTPKNTIWTILSRAKKKLTTIIINDSTLQEALEIDLPSLNDV